MNGLNVGWVSRRAWAWILLLAGLSAPAAAVAEIMPLSQIQPGMTGKGRTVFQGERIEEFDVEILGVMRNVQPRKNMIMARLSGNGLETTGVISGMSGSPVYIDGRIVGAVAYSFAFSKTPLAGITPIEEMMAMDSATSGAASSAPARSMTTIPSMTLEDLAAAYLSTAPPLAPVPPVEPDGRGMAPLHLPLVVSGFSPQGFEKARGFFAAAGFHPLMGGGGQIPVPSAKLPSAPALRPGDAVGIQLIGGDLDVSAVGTVTHVDGSRVLAFGHPLYNLGPVDLAMTRAGVLAVVPSLQTSFKLATSGEVLGSFSQDSAAGAVGEIGRMPRLIPVNISLQRSPTSRREFKLKMIRDRILTPALLNMALYSLLTGEERNHGDLALEFDGEIFLDRGGSVKIEDLFSGNYNAAVTNLSGLMAAVVYFLSNNEFQDVGIFRVDINIRSTQEARFCQIEKVLLDKYEVSPGERIGIQVHYRAHGRESRVEEVQVQAPILPAGSQFHLIVGDSAAMQSVERSQYRTQEFVPRSLDQLVRILSNLRKNNRIYFKITAAKPGLFLKGEEMPNLPPTLKTMFASPRAAASSATDLSRSTLNEYQLPVPYVVRGSAVIPVQIRR
ncbi:MAG: SpoIVB peptidase S55 domain-containing protein [Acidobacteriota bacterium]|nr:SpoIVB peptidase S55 domain-containing protein [Acidobacteriota bacterium]